MKNSSNQDMIIFRLNQIRNEELTERTELNTLINNFWTIDKKYLRELAFKKWYSERILHNIPNQASA